MQPSPLRRTKNGSFSLLGPDTGRSAPGQFEPFRLVR
jgi:hypothetical protein